MSSATVAVVGDGPAAGVHALAAEDAGLTRVAGDASVLVVAASARERLGLALGGLDRGASVLVDPPLTPAALEALLGADAGRGLLWFGDHRRFAPAWTTARRTWSGPADHVEVVASRPAAEGEGTDAVEVLGPAALAAVEDLGGPAASVRVDRAGRGAEVHVVLAAGGRATLRLDLAGRTAVWHAQAAGPDRVVTVELSPGTLVERNGDEVPVPVRHRTRDPRLEQLGYVDQLLAVAAGTGGEPHDDLRRLRLLAGA